jgi:hypothetical protein
MHDYQSKESLIDHFFDNSHACSSSYASGYDLKENGQGSDCEIIYNNDFEIENFEALHSRVMVMSGPRIVDSHYQSIFQDVGYHFTDHTTIEHDLESSHNDFKFQEINSMPIYDSDDITQVLISYHDLGPFTQVYASVDSDYIILATTCGKDILVNKSQPSCNIIVHNTNIFLSTLSLELLQSLMDIHPYFYDLVEIWLEGIFQERIISLSYGNCTKNNFYARHLISLVLTIFTRKDYSYAFYGERRHR